jgi:alpha-glucosidase (family GH31 glycosyl hydrolase)
MRAFVEQLHANGQHWIAITDAAVAVDKGYKAYEEGERDGVFLQSQEGGTYLGQVRL